MSLYDRKFISKLRKEDKGSFTLEASLVFPLIFIVTIVLILLSLVIYEKVAVYQKAYVIAERVAFTWDNSKKDFKTGAFARDEYTTTSSDMDGLYWRSNHIGASFIQKVFGSELGGVSGKKELRANEQAQIIIPAESHIVKVTDTAGFNQKVEVTLEARLKIPEFVTILTSNDLKFKVTASASIKDPVEIIRTTDFIFHYGNEVIKGLGK